MAGNADAEYLRLILEVTGQAEYDALQKKLQAVGATTKDLERQLLMGYISQAQYSKGMADAGVQARALQKEINALAAAQKNQAKAVQGAAGGLNMGNTARAVTQVGYAFQDMASAGGGAVQKLNAGMNNMQMLATMLPPQMQIAAQSALFLGQLGLVVYQNWGSVLRMFGGGHEIPKAARDLDGLNERLHDVKESLSELKKQGYLGEADFAKFNNLKTEEKALKEAVKAAATVKRLKESRSATQNDLVRSFEEALAATGPTKVLDALEKSVGATNNPALKGLYTRLVNQLEKGDYDTFLAVQQFAREHLGEAGKDLAARMNSSFADIARSREQPMEAAVKKFKDEKKKIDDLEAQGRDIQADLMRDLAKDATDKLTDIFARPLEDFLVKSRSAGVDIKKETAYLRNQIEAEAAKMFPAIRTGFPQLFGQIVDGLRVAMTESVDKMLDQLMAAENLTRQQAARRLERERQRKAEGQQGELAQDEMEKFVQQAHNAARVPGQAPLTAAQRQAIAEQMRQGMRNAGMNPQQQIEFGKMINNPNFRPLVPQAMQGLMGQGMGMEQAAQFLPQVMNRIMGQFANGARNANVGTAVDQVIAQLIQNQAKLANRQGNMNARQAAQLRAAQQIGQMLQPQQDPGLNFGGFP